MSAISVRSTNLENYVISDIGVRYNAAYTRVLRYFVDVRHKTLNLHKEVSAPEVFILESKLTALVDAWDEKYAQYQTKRRLESSKDEADDLTDEAEIRLESLDRILAHTLKVNDAVDWDALKDRTLPPESAAFLVKKFPQPEPRFSPAPTPQYAEPAISFLDLIFGRKAKKIKAAEEAHEAAVANWRVSESSRREQHEILVSAWTKNRDIFTAEQEIEKSQHLAQQDIQRREFLDVQASRNAKVDQLHAALERGEPEAVIEHASMVLDASDYDGLFEKSTLLQYHPDAKLLKVAYDLPCPDDLPTLKSVKFVRSTGELKETHISDREKRANFESVTYQIALRTLHELFEADEHGNLSKILFNGYVNFIDKSTGREARSCLLSVVAEKSAFEQIDLARVDPKTCFKSLKGVSAATLASLTPIPPVIEMDREDRRFVDARDVGSGLSADTNLASMSWEDSNISCESYLRRSSHLAAGK